MNGKLTMHSFFDAELVYSDDIKWFSLKTIIVAIPSSLMEFLLGFQPHTISLFLLVEMQRACYFPLNRKLTFNMLNWLYTLT